jgi:hypothetical protein
MTGLIVLGYVLGATALAEAIICLFYPQRRELVLTWRSANLLIWLWHALFDGTRICRCPHSTEYRRHR